jgi:hypothetical protein
MDDRRKEITYKPLHYSSVCVRFGKRCEYKHTCNCDSRRDGFGVDLSRSYCAQDSGIYVQGSGCNGRRIDGAECIEGVGECRKRISDSRYNFCIVKIKCVRRSSLLDVIGIPRAASRSHCITMKLGELDSEECDNSCRSDLLAMWQDYVFPEWVFLQLPPHTRRGVQSWVCAE